MFNFTIDYTKTRKAVEKFIWNYENMKFKLEETKSLSVTASFIMINPNKNAAPTSPVENNVIHSMEVEEKLMLLLSMIEKAFNRLTNDERKYLTYKHFSNIELTDEEIRDKMLLGYKAFSNLKRKTFIRFALSLGIEVYAKPTKAKN